MQGIQTERVKCVLLLAIIAACLFLPHYSKFMGEMKWYHPLLAIATIVVSRPAIILLKGGGMVEKFTDAAHPSDI